MRNVEAPPPYADAIPDAEVGFYRLSPGLVAMDLDSEDAAEAWARIKQLSVY
jgi:hypothetical protein